MLLLYDYADSGNCYKIRLLCEQITRDYRKIRVDIALPETMGTVLEMSENGRVPIVILRDGTRLFESNAILTYLANKSVLYSENPLDQSHILRWLFFEQNSHEPNIATLRSWTRLGKICDMEPDVISAKRKLGVFALKVMEAHLREHIFFACNRYTIADIALYAYTHVAVEGGFSLECYPAVQAWLERVRHQPRHVRLYETQSHG